MKNERMVALGRLSMASRTREQRQRFARIGGITANQLERAHKWTPETARSAGVKGGKVSAAKRAQRSER